MTRARTVALCGAGMIARAHAAAAAAAGLRVVAVASRTPERAGALADAIGAHSSPLETGEAWQALLFAQAQERGLKPARAFAVLGIAVAWEGFEAYYPLRHRSYLPVIISTIGASIFLANTTPAATGSSSRT